MYVGDGVSTAAAWQLWNAGELACANRVSHCRARLDAADLEITQLELRIDALRRNPPRVVEPIGDELAAPPTHRKAYAPPRLGAVPHIAPEQTPPPPPVIQPVAHPTVTNLGTLLDVLA